MDENKFQLTKRDSMALAREVIKAEYAYEANETAKLLGNKALLDAVERYKDTIFGSSVTWQLKRCLDYFKNLDSK